MNRPSVLNASLLRRCMFRIMALVVVVNMLNFCLGKAFGIDREIRDATTLCSVIVLSLIFVTGPILRTRDRWLIIAHVATTAFFVCSRVLTWYPHVPVSYRRSLDLLCVLGIVYSLCRCVSLTTRAERGLLERLAEGTSGRYSDHFLTSLCKTLVQSLELKCAFLSRLVAEEDAGEVVIATAKRDSKHSSSCSFPIVDSSIDLAAISAEAWFGLATVLPLTNHRDETTGHLVLIHTRSRELTKGQRAVLNAYASRAAAEVDRKHADEEKQELEIKLLQGQKLEGLGLLAGGVAHDFNNLLSAMRNHAALARSVVSEQSAVADNIRVIESAIDHGSGMCDRLLAYAGQSPRENAVFDFGKVLLDTVSIVEATHSSVPSIKISLSDEPAWVWGDASQVSQVILNLLTNAVDAMGPSSSPIEIETEIVESGSKSRVQLRVIDHGRGISRESLPRIFDPFYSTKEKGRGLGLASVAGVIKDHHGELDVESELGVGTCFSISIPLTDRRPVERGVNGTVRQAAAPSLEAHSMVLVVDDNELVRSSTKALLECSGFEVLPVAGGHEAIDAYKKYGDAISVVLLDQTMPVMNGLDTYKALRELGATADVVFMSGHSTLKFDDDLFEEVRFIRKPFTHDQLVSLLSENEPSKA